MTAVMTPPTPEERKAWADAHLYRKRPVDVLAAQWHGNVGQATRIIDWILAAGGTARFVAMGEDHPLRYEDERGSGTGAVYDLAPAFIVIDTLEGPHRANPQDWIIRGVQGEFYPCKPDIFAETYDEVATLETPSEPVAGRRVAQQIAEAVRRHCTLDVTLSSGYPIDATIRGVADWIENPPDWVNTPWQRDERARERTPRVRAERGSYTLPAPVLPPLQHGPAISPNYAELVASVRNGGGSVEIDGVKIVRCDEYGRTGADIELEEARKAASELLPAGDLFEIRDGKLQPLPVAELQVAEFSLASVPIDDLVAEVKRRADALDDLTAFLNGDEG